MLRRKWLLVVGWGVANDAASHVHVVALLDVVGGDASRVSAYWHVVYSQPLLAYPSWMESTAMSRNVTCAPSKTWPGYLSKKSSSWKTGA